LAMFAVGYVVFAPLMFADGGIRAFDIRTLLIGTHGHLWYLTSLPLALIVLYYLGSLRAWRTAIFLAASISVFYIVFTVDYAATHKGYDSVMLLRHLVGIPCILIGCAMRRFTHWSFARHAAVTVVGVAVLTTEVVAAQQFGIRSFDVQWAFSTPIITAGLLGMALTAPINLPNWLGTWGRQDSLGLYIYHPALMIIASSILAGRFTTSSDYLPSLTIWALTVVFTLTFLRGLRAFPRLRALADGDFLALSSRAIRSPVTASVR